MAEAKSIKRTKTLEQIIDQQMRLNNAIAKETYSLISRYPNGNMPTSVEARLRTLGARGARVTDAYIRMVNSKRKANK